MQISRLLHTAVAAGLLAGTALAAGSAANAAPPDDRGDEVAAYWTPARVAAAQPRDLVVDARGRGYLRGRDGALTPHGHNTPYALTQVTIGTPIQHAKPGGGSDTSGPTITDPEPPAGSVQGETVTFSAAVSDPSGVRSVTVVITLPGGATQSFAAGNLGGGRYGATITGFTEGNWAYTILAKDGSRGGGNTSSLGPIAFSVGSGGGGGGDGVVANAHWTSAGDIVHAAGRILFEMPTIRGNRTTWDYYVCSGTAVGDTNSGSSVIVTAAHCVYDDVAKMFARNVLFIPNQDGSTGATDLDCGNDPIGCWAPSHGVVDVNWTTRTFPDNVEWDYAYYVVPDADSHSGAGTNTSLSAAVDELTIGFDSAAAGQYTHALGYSYSDDPNFMYCAEDLGVETPDVNWWLASCGLSGGSSGGPWVQPMNTDTGSGPIVSVNSWGYTNQPGMAGPVLDGSAECVFATANDAATTPVERGVVVSGCTD
jgi:hypothetical protein